MPRLRRQRAISLGGSPVVGGRWDDARLAQELRVVTLRDGSGWHAGVMVGRREVGRLAHVPGVDAGGDWLWAVRFGATGYAVSREEALSALHRAWSRAK